MELIASELKYKNIMCLNHGVITCTVQRKVWITMEGVGCGKATFKAGIEPSQTVLNVKRQKQVNASKTYVRNNETKPVAQ